MPRHTITEGRIVEVTPDGCDHPAQHRRSVTQITRDPAHEVIGQRLDGDIRAPAVRELHDRPLAPCHGIQHADRPPARRAPGELRRSEDSRVVRHVGVGARRERVARRLRRPADASRIEHSKARDVRAEIAVEPTETEIPRALDEERAPFGEERFERREIHDGRIDLDLSEIRVDREVEREVRREQHAGVRTEAAVHRVRVRKRISGIRHGLVDRAAHDVRQDLRALR